VTNYSVKKVEKGTEITVNAKEAAVVVKENNEERIYLPQTNTKQTTYYTDNRKSLKQEKNVFKVVHTGTPDSIKVFSTQEN